MADIDALYAEIYGDGAAAPSSPGTRRYQSPEQWRQQLALDDLEDREHLPRGLLTAVLTRESRGYPTATSPKGAQGLFQFMPATAQAYRIDPTNPEQSADAAAKELGSHYKRYGGDLPQTLAAWNWGSGNVQKQGMANAPKETRNFISWVTGLLGPRSAEAAERPPMSARTTTQPATAPLALDDLYQQVYGSTPPAAVQQPPHATDTPAPASQAGPAPAPAVVAPGGPSEPDAQYAAQTIAAMRERQAQPARAALAMGQAPPATPPTPQPVTDPAAQLATAGSPHQSLNLQDLPWWGKAGMATGIGALGSGGGAALGALTGPAAPVAIPALEMGGSWLARKVNVALGLEEPGIVGDVASVAVPGFLRGVGALWRGGLRSGTLPGTGPVRHEMAQETLEGLARAEDVVEPSGQVARRVVEGRLLPATPAEALWQQARQSNPQIATVETWRTAGDVLRSLRNNPRITASHPGRQAAEDFFELARRSGGTVAIHDLDDMRRTLGPLAGRYPEVARIYGAILDDMESAVARNVPGAAPLRQAIATTRREHALDRLADLWAPGRGIQQAAGETTQVYGRRIQNQFESLMRSRLFRGAWSPEEVADIRQTLQQVNRLSSVSLAPGGTLTRQVARHGPAAIAGMLGWAQEGPERGATYAMAVEAFPYVMSYLLSTAAGRAAIRNAIADGGGRLGPAEMGALLTTLRQTGTAMGIIPSEAPVETRQAPGGAARTTD